MRVGFPILGYDPAVPSGINRFTEGVLGEWIAASEDTRAWVSTEGALRLCGDRARLVGTPRMAASSFSANLLRLIWLQIRLGRHARRAGVDALYFPGPEGALRPPAPQVVTVHDLLPLRYPDAHPRIRHYYRVVIPRIARASRFVATVSRSSAADLVEGLGVPEDRVRVIRQGYRKDIFHPEPGEDEGCAARPYLLAVGETRPHKNLPRLIRAFASLGPGETELWVVGRVNARTRALRALPAELGVADRVRFRGVVPDQELARLYRGAAAFVFPSLYEGFGIPVLEAMACGAPVVASRAASIPEVCGEAAEYVDPKSVESIAAGIQRILEDDALRRELAAAGPKRAQAFSYEAAARELRRVMAEAVG